MQAGSRRAWMRGSRSGRSRASRADPVPVEGASDPGGWRGLVYYRLHGAPRIYYLRYDDAALAELKLRLEESRVRGADAWCIFDNTASGAAFGNALTLAA
jgi:uncharacterized protein YecE (DUF72 family)